MTTSLNERQSRSDTEHNHGLSPSNTLDRFFSLTCGGEMPIGSVIVSVNISHDELTNSALQLSFHFER
jgi:hypothetical protein